MELDGCWWTFSCDLIPKKGTNCWSSLLQNGNFGEISTIKDRQTKLWGHISVGHQLQTTANIRVGTTNVTIKWYINFSFFKNNYFFIHYRSSLCYYFFFIWFCNLFYRTLYSMIIFIIIIVIIIRETNIHKIHLFFKGSNLG